MKYRIKDDKLRKAAIILFGDLAKEFDYGSNLTAIEVSFAPLHSIDNKLSCIFHPLTNELEIEPVKELAEGWNPYPRVKPQKEGQYYCVHRHSPSDPIIHSVITFHNKRFVDWNNLIFGWMELPKVWKGD